MSDILERHGITGALKMCGTGSDGTQAVTVDDGNGRVILALSGCSYPAAMTSEQARMVAKFLNAAAARVDRRPKP